MIEVTIQSFDDGGWCDVLVSCCWGSALSLCACGRVHHGGGVGTEASAVISLLSCCQAVFEHGQLERKTLSAGY
jgi:hypothetical protein